VPNVYITKYNAICNLGTNIEEIFVKALNGDSSCFELDNSIINEGSFYFGKVKNKLPKIIYGDYELRCNQLLLHCCNQIQTEIDVLIDKYGRNRIGVVIATTNTGVEEFELTKNNAHAQIGNPALYLKKHLGLQNYYASVSTACTSGIKAFSSAKKLLEHDICSAVIVGGVDALAKLPIFGFHSLEVLSEKKTNPFSQNRDGITIGEGAALFIVEKNVNEGIKILGIGETSDAHHSVTPNPDGKMASKAIEQALLEANIKARDIDYINLHGTGTYSNDLMEANAVHRVFKDETYASSTKPLTGHCLGASASIEVALCCQSIQNDKLLPHVYDGQYGDELAKIKLVESQMDKNISNCLCNSFGFGGSNAVIILGK